MISLLRCLQKLPLVISALHLPPMLSSHHPDAQTISTTINYAFNGKT